MIDHLKLKNLVEEALQFTNRGNLADYIPALMEADKHELGVVILTKEGKFIEAGDFNTKFTMQSTVKVISFIICLMEYGPDYVFEKVNIEPTGDGFDAFPKIDKLNPFSNSGALVVCDMLPGSTVNQKIEKLLKMVKKLTDDNLIDFNEKVAYSEYQTANKNRSLSYFLKEKGIITSNVETNLEFYTKMCAVEVKCHHLARIGAIIANDGIDYLSNKKVIPSEIAHIVKSCMLTSGMYNASGEFAMKVGIPTKSGVSGALLCAIPQGGGIGIYGPSLDEKGNSIAGIKLMELISKKFRLGIFNNSALDKSQFV